MERELGGSLERGLSEKGHEVLKEKVLAIESRAMPLKTKQNKTPKQNFKAEAGFRSWGWMRR